MEIVAVRVVTDRVQGVDKVIRARMARVMPWEIAAQAAVRQAPVRVLPALEQARGQAPGT